MLRRRRNTPIDPLAHLDPASLGPRWAPPVADALAARQRWAQVVEGTRPGPLRDRLAELSARVDEGVLAVAEVAEQAAAAERLAAGLDVERITAEHKRIQRDPSADPALAEAVRHRFVAAQRVLNAVDDAEGRLQLLDARLGAAVARGAEVALAAGDEREVGVELRSVVDELAALRTSLASLEER